MAGAGGRSTIPPPLTMPTVQSYTDPEYFLRDAPSADITITSRSSRTQEMTALEAMEVADMDHHSWPALLKRVLSSALDC